MGDHTVVVVGASAGGVAALQILVANLPADLPAVLLVVLHQPAGGHSALPRILARAGPLPTSHALHARPLKVAHITIAPPDQHLLVHEDMTVLSDGPTEHHHRPAVDPLFRSAARWHRDRVIGVILSGALNDGASGGCGHRVGRRHHPGPRPGRRRSFEHAPSNADRRPARADRSGHRTRRPHRPAGHGRLLAERTWLSAAAACSTHRLMPRWRPGCGRSVSRPTGLVGQVDGRPQTGRQIVVQPGHELVDPRC
jgi:hypothetical protein